MIEVWTDGGVRGNGKETNIGGWGALLRYKGKEKEIYGSDKNTTNNKMELMGVIRSLSSIKTTNIPIKVYSDSAYVVNGMNEWVTGWEKRKWVKSDKKPVLNKELWQELLMLSRKQDDIQFIWVRGHNDDEGNERADMLANKAMDESSE